MANNAPLTENEIKGIGDAFGEAWSEGTPPDLQAFVQTLARPHNLALVEQIVLLDLAYRDDFRLPVPFAEYYALCPQHQTEIETLCNTHIRDNSIFSRFDEPEVPVAMPAKIGKYRVIEHLGSGGQADVFRAAHPMLQQDVVIKVSRHHSSDDSSTNERLIQEGRLLTALVHPNICRVLDLDLYDGRPFIVMQYIEGKTLTQHTLAHERELIHILRKLATALQFAHEKGVIHHDIKPGNVMLDELGEPYLIDFGLARVTGRWSDHDGVIAGTPDCMAPEQARGEKRIGPWTDIFALGALQYFMMTGRPLYRESSITKTLERAQQGDVDFAELAKSTASSRLKRVCRTALQLDPIDRYKSAKSFAAALPARPQARASQGDAVDCGIADHLGGQLFRSARKLR